jgi:hypothetical protein
MTPAANFAISSPCVVDTGGKFATGVNDTGGKFAAGVNDPGGKLPPVSYVYAHVLCWYANVDPFLRSGRQLGNKKNRICAEQYPLSHLLASQGMLLALQNMLLASQNMLLKPFLLLVL